MTKKILLAILTVALVFVMTACKQGDGDNTGTELGAITYSGMNGTDLYALTISQSSARAAYGPQNGDTYYLIIADTSAYNTSTGRVTISGSTLTLSKGGGVVTVSGSSITGITGSITLDQGSTKNPSGSWTSTGAADASLNGTWVKGSYTIKINNGTYEYSGNAPYEKGTFITYNASTAFVIPTHYWGKSYESSLQARWYTMGELLTSYPSYESTIRSYYSPYTVTYTTGGNTLSLYDYGTSSTFTKK
jgi:hypothetical protein